MMDMQEKDISRQRLDVALKSLKKSWELFKANRAGYFSLWGILFFIFLGICSLFVPLLGPEYDPMKAEETVSKVVLKISSVKNQKANILILKDWDINNSAACQKDLESTFQILSDYTVYLDQYCNELLERYASFSEREKKFREKYKNTASGQMEGAFSLVFVMESAKDRVGQVKDSYERDKMLKQAREKYESEKEEYLKDENVYVNDAEKMVSIIDSAKEYTKRLNSSAQKLDILKKEIRDYEQVVYPFPRAPTFKHLLGQDNQGRDLFCQLLVGASMAIRVGVIAAFSAVVLGTIFGLISGYFGGMVDVLIMRFADILMCLPYLPLFIVIAGVMGGISIWNLVILIGLFSWPGLARVIRAQTLTLKTRPYVESAKVSGASKLRIIFKHIGPNVLAYSLLYMSFLVSGAILTEGALSFLGFGDSSQVSWGMMLQWCFTNGSTFSAPYWLLPPGLAISLLSLFFYLVGRACDEIINPRLRKRG